MFIDDNLTADPDYARELFQALVPLKKRWITQSSLAMMEKDSLAAEAAEAGCVGIFAGLESFQNSNLQSVNKTCHQVDHYQEAIHELHRLGIGVEAGIVLGFGHDGPGVFEKTLEQLDQLEIDAAQISILTPMPGTRLHQNLAAQIIDRDWSHYDYHHAVFEPKTMTAEALQQGHDWLTHEFYRPARIMRRLQRWLHPMRIHTLPFAAAINLAYYGRIRQWRIGSPQPTPKTIESGWANPWWTNRLRKATF